MKKGITEINVHEQERWNNTVKSISNYDVFYLNEYVLAFMREEEKNGIPILLYYENNDERAINVVFKRDIAKDDKFKNKIKENSYFDLISPYGYGGFLGNIVDYSSLNEEYNHYCLQNGYICEFVRFELLEDYYKYYDGEIESRTHNVVRSLDLPIDDLWMDFKQKVRKNVKRARENGLEIITENTHAHLKDFLAIYYSTMARNNAQDSFYFSKEFYECINRMKDNIMYFHVLRDEKIISTELVLYGAENAYSYLGGTYKEYYDLRPNDFLKFEIIKWAKEKGLKNFVLGGGYGTDDGIFQYKTCLAPRGIVDFYIGRKIFNREAYDYLLNLRIKDNPTCKEAAFFPQYRA